MRGIMRVGRFGAGAVVLLSILASGAFGQSGASARGELTSIDASRSLLVVKTSDGAQANVAVSAATEYLRVEPGKKSLEGAARISLADLNVGDKVWARGTEKDASGAIVARQLVVMSAAAISERNERDARDWQARGMFGEVTAIDAARGEMTIESRRGGSVVVAVAPSTPLHRLKPGATSFEGATPIKLADLAVGDQVAVRGDRSADGARVTAEAIVTGDLPRRAGGRVTAIDQAKGEVLVESRDGRPVTILVPKEALVRKLTPSPNPGAEGEGRARAGGFGFGLGDRAELERRTAPLALAEIAPGDFVFAISEPGSKGDEVRAAILIKMDVPAGRQRGGAPSMDFGEGVFSGGGPQ
jgi:hypothetical protein